MNFKRLWKIVNEGMVGPVVQLCKTLTLFIFSILL